MLHDAPWIVITFLYTALGLMTFFAGLFTINAMNNMDDKSGGPTAVKLINATFSFLLFILTLSGIVLLSLNS